MSHLKDLVKKNMITAYIEKAYDLSSWNMDYINFFNENCEQIFNTFYQDLVVDKIFKDNDYLDK